MRKFPRRCHDGPLDGTIGMVGLESAMSGRSVRTALRCAVGAVLTALCALAVGLAAALAVGLAGPAPASAAEDPQLYLVTLEGGGLSTYRGPVSPTDYRELLRGEQDIALAGVGADEPVYRWTSALNGVAVPLTADQAQRLAIAPSVERVERNSVRRLAAAAAPAPAGGGGGDPTRARRRRGRRGSRGLRGRPGQ